MNVSQEEKLEWAIFLVKLEEFIKMKLRKPIENRNFLMNMNLT